MAVISAIVTAIGIPVALAVPWFPKEASTQASNVHTLYDVLLIVSVPIFVLVTTVVLFSVWKFRMKPGQENEDGPPIHGNTRLEVIWTATPAALIVGLCVFAYAQLHANEANKAGARTINVTERQFAFEFSYQKGKGTVVTPELYMAKGQPVVFRIRSLDVIHSFFVPDFSEKIDAVPGITTVLRVTPTQLGTYPVECTELCGPGHSLMRTAVHVLTPAAFQTWLADEKTGAAPPVGTPPPFAVQAGVPGAGTVATTPASGSTGSSGSSSGSSGSASATTPAAGKAIFLSSGCGSCHTLAAAGTTGAVGPNLDTAIVADAKKAGQPLDPFISTSITNPNAYIAAGFKAGLMPTTLGQSLSPTQVKALVNFIASVTK
jgi:cytochrome c oxidase subunit 2